MHDDEWKYSEFKPIDMVFTKCLNSEKKLCRLPEFAEISAPKKKLILAATKSLSSCRKSSHDINKQFQILAKGHNET
jgi:hypothetical protein